MAETISMPKLGFDMAEGTLVRWVKNEGENVNKGDVLAEIETDKATMEYEAVDEGTLAKIVVPEGTQDVPVRALIAVLAEEGEDVKAAAAAAGKGAPLAMKRSFPISLPLARRYPRYASASPVTWHNQDCPAKKSSPRSSASERRR